MEDTEIMVKINSLRAKIERAVAEVADLRIRVCALERIAAPRIGTVTKRALLVLAARGGDPAGVMDIAGALGVDRPAARVALNRLAWAGKIERVGRGQFRAINQSEAKP